MGGLHGSFFGSIHTASTGTRTMAHLIDAVLRLEPKILSMVRRPLPQHYFHLALTPGSHNHILVRTVPRWFKADK